MAHNEPTVEAAFKELNWRMRMPLMRNKRRRRRRRRPHRLKGSRIGGWQTVWNKLSCLSCFAVFSKACKSVVVSCEEYCWLWASSTESCLEFGDELCLCTATSAPPSQLNPPHHTSAYVKAACISAVRSRESRRRRRRRRISSCLKLSCLATAALLLLSPLLLLLGAAAGELESFVSGGGSRLRVVIGAATGREPLDLEAPIESGFGSGSGSSSVGAGDRSSRLAAVGGGGGGCGYDGDAGCIWREKRDKKEQTLGLLKHQISLYSKSGGHEDDDDDDAAYDIDLDYEAIKRSGSGGHRELRAEREVDKQRRGRSLSALWKEFEAKRKKGSHIGEEEEEEGGLLSRELVDRVSPAVEVKVEKEVEVQQQIALSSPLFSFSSYNSDILTTIDDYLSRPTKGFANNKTSGSGSGSKSGGQQDRPSPEVASSLGNFKQTNGQHRAKRGGENLVGHEFRWHENAFEVLKEESSKEKRIKRQQQQQQQLSLRENSFTGGDKSEVEDEDELIEFLAQFYAYKELLWHSAERLFKLYHDGKLEIPNNNLTIIPHSSVQEAANISSSDPDKKPEDDENSGSKLGRKEETFEKEKEKDKEENIKNKKTTSRIRILSLNNNLHPIAIKTPSVIKQQTPNQSQHSHLLVDFTVWKSIIRMLNADHEGLMNWLRQKQKGFPTLTNTTFELLKEYPNSSINICKDGHKILILPDGKDILHCYTRDQWIGKLWSDLRLSSFHYPIIVLNILIFLFGTTGNIFVCLSVYRNHQLRNVTNYFIVNLAFADFLVILICLPTTGVWDLTLTWFFGTIPCKLIMFLQDVSISVSVLTLTAISLDRYYAICHPLKFKTNLSQAKRIIVIIWLVSFAIMMPDLIYLSAKESQELSEAGLDTVLYSDCNYDWSSKSSSIFQFVKTILLYLIPLILMFCAHYTIMQTLRVASTSCSNELESMGQMANIRPLGNLDNHYPHHHHHHSQYVSRQVAAPGKGRWNRPQSQHIPRSHSKVNPPNHFTGGLRSSLWANKRRSFGLGDSNATSACSIPLNGPMDLPAVVSAQSSLTISHHLVAAGGQPHRQDTSSLSIQDTDTVTNGNPKPANNTRKSGGQLAHKSGQEEQATDVGRQIRFSEEASKMVPINRQLESTDKHLNLVGTGSRGQTQIGEDTDERSPSEGVDDSENEQTSSLTKSRKLELDNKRLIDVIAKYSPESNPSQQIQTSVTSRLVVDSARRLYHQSSLDSPSPIDDQFELENEARFGGFVADPTTPDGQMGQLLVTIHNRNRIESRKKAATMLAAIVVIFGICYLPVHLINFLRQFIEDIPQTDVTSTISMLSHCACYLNSAINPIIYNHMNSKFRAEFRKFLSCLCLRKAKRRPSNLGQYNSNQVHNNNNNNSSINHDLSFAVNRADTERSVLSTVTTA